MRGAGIIGAFVPPIPPLGASSNGRAMTRTTSPSSLLHRPRRRPRPALDDRGAATAEYAIATMAAVGFASLLVVIMQSDEVRGILTDLVRTALTVGG
jgi:hypothetical protein